MIEALLEAVLYPVFEAVVRLPGYALIRFMFPDTAPAFDGFPVFFAGLAAWLLTISSVFAGLSALR